MTAARTDQVREIVQALVGAGHQGLRSDVLAAQWPRAQARLHEARLHEGHVISTRTCEDTGLAIYTYVRRGKAKGQHDLGLRITWRADGQPTAKTYSPNSLSGLLPDEVVDEATQAAQQAVWATLEGHGYVGHDEGSEPTTSTQQPVSSAHEPWDDEDVAAILDALDDLDDLDS